MSDETARITFANKRYEEVFGRPADDMEGDGWRRVVHPDDLNDFHSKFLQAFLARERVVMEVRVFDRAGALLWLRCEGVPRFTSDGQFAGYVGVNLDVTEAKRAEEEFRASAEFNDRILSASRDCIKVLDLEARLQFMSAGGRGVMEVSDFETIRGCPWPEFWSGEHRKAVEEAIATAKAGGEGRFRGHAPTAKGTPRWWDVVVTAINGPNGKPERLLSVSRDVTAEHRAQEAVRRSEAELRDLNATLGAAGSGGGSGACAGGGGASSIAEDGGCGSAHGRHCA
jgi:PAS domain S-box-containing protein